jgi:2-dehydropantoate 2-reductase
MKILMFGRGVISTAYGWALSAAGHEVEFYVRPGRAEVYGEAITFDLLDARRRFQGERTCGEWSVQYREALEPDHDFDLIVLSVQHYRVAEAVRFLALRLGNATLLMFSNMCSDPQEVAERLPQNQLAWGFPQAGGGFDKGGVLRAALLKSVVFGSFGNTLTERESALRQMFRDAGFRINEQRDYRGWLLIHFLSNAGLFSQGLRIGSLSELFAAKADLRQALLAVRELLPIAEKRGIDLSRHLAVTLPFLLPAWLMAVVLSLASAYFAPGRVSLEGNSDPNAEEPRAVCRDALAEARRLGIMTPRLAASETFFSKSLN